jgi:ferredoxin
MKRKIVKIDEEKCTGCGMCIPNCHEGALQIIDNKARLISDLFCDGLGACLGHCPEDAITIEEREAEPYDERKVMDTIISQGENTIIAHISHLKDHGETGYYNEAMAYLKEKGIIINTKPKMETIHKHHEGGCPGSLAMNFNEEKNQTPVNNNIVEVPSQLKQWPVQLHLLNPSASYFKNADVLLAADCVAFAVGNFHNDFMKDKSLAIACPKLDSNKESYIEKITAMIDDAQINTLTVAMMEVPCCGGLLQIAKAAAANAKRKVPIKTVIVSIRGQVLAEEWV